jgi:hypothetical protein
MAKAKYIKTKDNEIIVFGELMNHSDFRHLNPVSAGFINFGLDDEKNVTCACFGESISLRLKSDEKEDTFFAQRQLGLRDY